MKKKNISKQISKILAVGISATLSFQPLTVLAMEENASFDDQAEAALESVEYTTEALVSDTDITYIPEVSEDNGPSAETATQEEHDLISEIIVDADAATTDSSTGENLYDLATDKLEEADGHLDDAATALSTAQSQNAIIEKYNSDLDAAEDALEKVVENPEGDSLYTGVTIEGRETTSPFTGRDITIKGGKVSVDEYLYGGEDTAVNNAYNAMDGYVGIDTEKGDHINGSMDYSQDAIDGYTEVIADSTDYVASGVNGDSTGQLLIRIETDAANADKNLEEAKKAFERADEDLKKAEINYAEADIAYEDAFAKYAAAKTAYENLAEPEFGKESANSYITAAKSYLEQAKNDFEQAKDNLETARGALNDKVEALDSAQYEDLLAKRNAIDEAASASEKEAASDAFAKAVIGYYFRAEKGVDITVPDDKIDFDYKDIIPVEALSEDGTKYISGYGTDYKPVYSLLPEKASVYSISYADNEKEDSRDHYFLFTYDGEKVDLTEFTFNNGEGITEQKVELPGRYVSGGSEIDIDDEKYKVKITTDDEVVHLSELDKKIGGYAISGEPEGTDTTRYLKISSGSVAPVYMTDDVIVDDKGTFEKRTGFVVEDYSTYWVQERTKQVIYKESPEYSWVNNDNQRWFATDQETANATAERLNEEHAGYRHYVSKEWDTQSQSYKYYILQKQISAVYTLYGRWTTVKNDDGSDRTVDVTTSKSMYESIDCTFEEGDTQINYLKYYNPSQNGSKVGGQGTVLDVNNDGGYTDQQNFYELLKQFEASDLAYRNAEEALKKAIADVNALTAADKKKRVDAEQALEVASRAVNDAYVDQQSAFAVLLEAVYARNFADELYWDAEVQKIQAYDALGKAQKAYRDRYNRDPHTPRSYTALSTSYVPEEDETYTYDESETTTVTTTLMAAAPSPATASVLGETRTIAQPAKATMTAKASQTNEEAPEEEQVKEEPAVQNENPIPEKQEEVQTAANISDDNTAKTDVPIVMATHFAWGWVTLILAAGAGVAAEEYVRRRSAKAKAGNGNDKTDKSL